MHFHLAIHSYRPTKHHILCYEEPGHLLYGNFYWTQPEPGTLLQEREQSYLFPER